MAIDPVAGISRTDAVQNRMGESGTSVSLSRDVAQRLSQLSENAGITRKEMIERLIMQARG